ncbi:hypothetical protein RRG08_049799 [Elysia crispata]|uniref:Uncharacterized protein n=1 Tax=Elysia crispata TaxID=231223 RepID=A0AAE0YU91_9GAST|nr:hypothetical protein RRG08_049799 [Elysia crispata]
MENHFVSPVMCRRTSFCDLGCALQIDGEPVCVTFVVRSILMENQFVSPVICAPDRCRTSLCRLRCAPHIDGQQSDGKPVCVTCDVRSRLIENQFDDRFRWIENQFLSPAFCAPD